MKFQEYEENIENIEFILFRDIEHFATKSAYGIEWSSRYRHPLFLAIAPNFWTEFRE
jgi:hypothetical protein